MTLANDHTTGDPAVAVMTNLEAAGGTSFAAPAALAYVQQITSRTGASAQIALQAAKQAIALNGSHQFVLSKGIAQVSLQTGVPVTFGVLTTDTIEQAIERAGTKAGNKGWDAAVSAVEMVSLAAALGAAGL